MVKVVIILKTYLPNVRPWNAPLKLRMESGGQPGAELSIDELRSSCDGGAPSRCLSMYAMNTFGEEGGEEGGEEERDINQR